MKDLDPEKYTTINKRMKYEKKRKFRDYMSHEKNKMNQ